MLIYLMLSLMLIFFVWLTKTLNFRHCTFNNTKQNKIPLPLQKKNLPPQFAFKLLVSNISAPALFIYFLFPPPPSKKKAGIIESKLFWLVNLCCLFLTSIKGEYETSIFIVVCVLFFTTCLGPFIKIILGSWAFLNLGNSFSFPFFSFLFSSSFCLSRKMDYWVNVISFLKTFGLSLHWHTFWCGAAML